MRIQDIMTRDVRICDPDQPIREAARLMAEADSGFLPIGKNDRLVGMLTDRDIAVRAVARGLSPDTPVSEIMSREVLYCTEDDDVDDVCENMSEEQIRRLPVVNQDKRLVGVVSLSDIARSQGGDEEAGSALAGICRPGGEHNQHLGA